MPRGVVAVLAGLAVFLFVGMLPVWYLLPEGVMTWLLQVGVAGWMGWTAGRSVMRRGTPGEGEPGLGTAVAVGALSVGTVGFLLGFLGPMLLDPGANQGPLLGIFITGPLGLVVGAAAGAALHFKRTRRQP
jgi:hypothetical protein